ncbi:unnamed protein product [Musa acuminata subsp. burmannicoides]
MHMRSIRWKGRRIRDAKGGKHRGWKEQGIPPLSILCRMACHSLHAKLLAPPRNFWHRAPALEHACTPFPKNKIRGCFGRGPPFFLLQILNTSEFCHPVIWFGFTDEGLLCSS